ncbi:MAG: ankyrin repeat domain-containing protein [Legionella sp.]|uniref:ankyrin repeat domain-containing protein n=1 Tax=Legionella sp. TaxID=459 RepID=UPI00283C5968|nr:ankyrin repeat domain-containing protein [Legionella sp.]
MPRHRTSPPPQTNFGFADLSPEILARITPKLPAARLADFRLVCKQFATLGAKDATLVWINKHFPATMQPALPEQQQGPITLAQNNMSEIDAILTKKSPNTLLPEQIMPLLLELQHYELEPLYRNFDKIEEKDSRKSIKAILPELAHIFLWIKTGNMAQLKKVKWADLNILWLLNNLDQNHLSAFDWAQITGNQELLDIFYNKASRLMYLNAGFGEFSNGVFDNRYQTNILHLAIRCNQTPQQLLKAIYSVDIMNMIPLINAREENSLHFAARSLNPRWLEYLLTKIQDNKSLVTCLEQKNRAGLTPLQVAAQLGNWRAVSLLALFGAKILNLNRFLYKSIDLDQRERKVTRFHLAAQCLRLSEVTELLASDPYFDINTPDEDGLTLLHIACSRGDLALVKNLVLSRKANCLLANDEGWTALHCAIASHNVKLIKYLLQHIDDLSQIKPTREGLRLSHMVIKYGNMDVIKLFKAQIIAELTTRDENGNIPLALALKEGRHKQVHGVLSILPPTQQVPVHCLHLAAMSKDPGCLAQLVSRVVNVDIPDNNKNTALHLAAGAGNVEGVLCLLNANAAINARDAKGRLPEHYAKESGNNMLICLFECLRYGKETGTGFWDRKVAPKKANAARALENVLLGKAEYATLEPYMDLFSAKGSKSLACFYKAFLPLIAPHLVKGDVVAQADAIASSSNSKK